MARRGAVHYSMASGPMLTGHAKLKNGQFANPVLCLVLVCLGLTADTRPPRLARRWLASPAAIGGPKRTCEGSKQLGATKPSASPLHLPTLQRNCRTIQITDDHKRQPALRQRLHCLHTRRANGTGGESGQQVISATSYQYKVHYFRCCLQYRSGKPRSPAS